MKINFIYDSNVSLEQMIGYEIAALLWGQLFTDNIEINIFAKGTDSLESNVIGGAIPEFHEQHYALFLQYYEADITSPEDQAAFDALQEGNTIDFLLNGELIDGNTKLKLTTALAKALGMTEAISLERYLLNESEHFLDGTIMMNQGFAWDFNYHRDSEAAENALDFLSVALHETGHILGFTSSLDFSLQQDTLYSGRTELSNFSPLDLFRFSAESLGQNNPDGVVNDLSIGGVAWFSTDGGETLSARMSTGKEGDGFQASHWERRYNPVGIMDPTLWYQERISISDLDILAFDIMGYDLAINAGDVENFFTPESLELLLAQAKVKVATKMGYSLEQLENNATAAPSTSLTLFEEMGIDYYTVITDAQTVDNTTLPPDTSGDNNNIDDLSDRELKDFFKDLDKMMDDIYRWWARNHSGHDDDHRGRGRNGASWQEFYEWFAANNSSGNSSWQELFEWLAANNSSGNSSWQELYEWYAANNSSGNSSWQELFEWWAGNNSSGNSSWQELSEEELAKFHQEVTGNQPAWWQQVFFASQDGGNLLDIQLPGEGQDTIVGPIHYQELNGGHDDDIFGGDLSNDTIVGGKGDDLMDGAAGDDTIFGAGGFDTIFGFDGNDSIMGGVGDDVISGESDEDVLFGQAGADLMMGGDDDDYLDGGTGGDFLNGNRGDDALIGGAGDDALEGESGKDLLVGGEGQDIGNGGRGDDFIFGDQYSASVKQAFGSSLTPLTSLFTPAAAPETTTDSGSTSDSTEELITVVLGQDPILIEAETMGLSGDFRLYDKFALASGGILVKNDSETTLATEFTGIAGLYNIVVNYHDVKGTGEIIANLDGVAVDSWLLNQDLGGKKPDYNNLTTHTIGNVTLNEGDIFSLDAIRHKDDKGYIDSIQFVPVENTNTQNTGNTNNNIVLDPVRIEAENFNWTGNEKVDNKDFASGGGYVFNDSKNSTITTSTTFTGESGVYNVVLGYYDSKKGDSQVTVNLNGTELDSWLLNLNHLHDHPDTKSFVTRTLAYEVNIEQGDVLEIEGIRYDNDDKVYLDFLEFVPFNPNATVKIEAEYFNLTGNYNLQEEDFAASGRLIKTDSNATLTTEFTGKTGLYNIIVGYHDVKGTGQLSASLEGSVIDNWSLTKDLGGDNPDIGSFTFRMISDVSINTGDIFSLSAIKDDKDKGYIDYVEFVPVVIETPEPEPEPEPTSEPNPVQLPPGVNLGDNSDILRGAQGNDGIDGGEGNDIIFGENELNDSSYISAPLIDGAVTYGHSSYILTNPNLTWAEAQAEAESYGGNLVTINDAAEETWLKQTFGTEIFWIGLTDQDVEGQWEWASGETVTYSNWFGNNDQLSDSRDYAAMNYAYNHKWVTGVLDYGEASRGIIEVDWSSVGGNDTIFGGAGDDQVYGNSGNDVIHGDYDDSYTATNNTPETLTFQQNVNGYNGTVDTFLHGGTPSQNNSSATSLNIDSDDNGSSVQSLLRFDNIFGSQAGQIALNDTINSAVLELKMTGIDGDSFNIHEMLQAWTDSATWNSLGNGIQANGEEAASTLVVTTNPYVTADLPNNVLTIDVTASLQAWQANPNANHGWAFLPTGTDGVDFNSAEGTIAPRLVVDVNQGSSASNTLPDGLVHNGSLYFQTGSQMSWSDAQAYGESLGGNLVTINDANENAWLDSRFTDYGLWIGLNDEETEGVWQWASGETSSFTDWHTGQPDGNNTAGQDYAVFNWGTEWRWDDQEVTASNFGLVEVELPFAVDSGYVHNGSLYLLTDSALSWQAAQAQAESLGGNLVTLNDAAEEQWIQNTFGSSEDFWIGFTDQVTEGQWQWVSGQEVTYTNWYPGNPNNLLNQDHALMNFFGQWDDDYGSKNYRGVIEIELSTIELSTTASGGNDNIFGNGGHDTIDGGGGNDTINGTDEVVAGYLERDVLVGGAGADTFILGDDTQAYYATGGSQDYAVIKDFDQSQDTVQLYGMAADYQQQQQGDDIHLSRNGDLVAIVEQNSTLNLNGSGFEYVITI